VVTQALYPAICAVRDRADLLFESFVKSNRLALMWGMPFGLGVALFASDLVHFVIGEQWVHAIVVIQAFGIVAAADQLGFKWTAFLRALDRTRPLAVVAIVYVAAFFAIAVPLLIIFGLRGLAVGWLATAAVMLSARTYYLSQLFSGLRMARHMIRAIAPSVPAVGLVLLARLAYSGDRGPGIAVAELVLYVCVTVAATVFFERELLREVLGYLGRPPSDRVSQAAESGSTR
jgi:O-antigen/teichoic acid export membrane protein